MYSYSRLSSYDNCPLQYKLRYLDRLQRPVESIEAFLGNRVHEVLRRLYSDAGMEKQVTLAEALEHYERRWERLYHPAIRIARREYGPQHYREVGRRCLSDYYQRHAPFREGRVLGCETKIFVDLGSAPAHRLVGYIDRLVRRDAGVYEIHDYKTGNSLPDQRELDADQQLALYQIGLQQRFPDAERVELVWHYLAHDIELRSERDREALEGLRRRTVERIERLEALDPAGEFAPRQSPLCGWCEYRDLCPLWKDQVELERLQAQGLDRTERAELVEQYAELVASERELSERRRDLEAALGRVMEQQGITRVFSERHCVEAEGLATERRLRLRKLEEDGQLKLF